jgi:dihydrodipicolinate synthase/N-acetylneuraminate lyase
MAVLRLPRGLIIDLVTPLTRGGDIDGRGLKNQLDRVLPHVQALFVSSPYMGEGDKLGTEQREELLEKTLLVIQERVPVFMWVSRETDEKTRETLISLKKRVELRRYKGPLFWVDTPLYYHSNRGLPDHYKEMVSIAEGPFILHNDPHLNSLLNRPFKRNNIRTGILKELVRARDIRGLIFSGSLERAYNYQKAVRTRTDFRIYDGDESHFLAHPSLHGIVSKGANLAPRAWQKITTASLNLNGSRCDYPDYMKQVWETGRYLNNMKDIYDKHGAAIIKAVLSKMGVIEEPGFVGRTDDMDEEVSGIADLMDKYGDY